MSKYSFVVYEDKSEDPKKKGWWFKTSEGGETGPFDQKSTCEQAAGLWKRGRIMTAKGK